MILPIESPSSLTEYNLGFDQRVKTGFLARLVASLGFFLPSTPTRWLFRLAGHRIGRNTRLPFFSFVCANKVELGNDIDIRPFVFINVDRLTIGSNTIVSFGCQIKGDTAFRTGDNCILGAHVIVHCDEDVTLGFYAGVGPRSTIYTHGSFLPVTRGYPALFAEVQLEDYVWTGMGVLFLPGSHIEPNCIINPGVVVSGRVPANTRLQLSTEATQKLDQAKLLKFSRRKPDFYHQKMIEEFLEEEGNRCSASPDRRTFEGADGIAFTSKPEQDTIEIFRDGRLIASYDIDGFWTTESSDRMHRRFLAFVRMRYGLILRTRYS